MCQEVARYETRSYALALMYRHDVTATKPTLAGCSQELQVAVVQQQCLFGSTRFGGPIKRKREFRIVLIRLRKPSYTPYFHDDSVAHNWWLP